jgi:hypothetical protein
MSHQKNLSQVGLNNMRKRPKTHNRLVLVAEPTYTEMAPAKLGDIA